MTRFFLKKLVILLKKQGFIHGAIILIVANAISKILGAVFKIPLTYILHEEGMGIFNSAFTVYAMGLSIVTAGFPVAISKGISAATVREELKRTAVMSKCSMILLGTLGITGTCVLYFGAEFFAYAIKEPLAVNAIKTSAPAVAAVALGTVFKAYFQGTGNMTPTAISQVIESICRLVIGFSLAFYFAGSLANSAAGAIGGIMIGEFIATGILWALYEKNKIYRGRCCVQKAVYREILSISMPLMLASLAANMISVVEVSVIRHGLSRIIFAKPAAENLVLNFGKDFLSVIKTGKLSDECVNWLYGAYTGYAVTLFHLPTGIISTFGISLFPVIAGAYATGNMEKVRRSLKKGILTVMILAIPSAILLFFLSSELLGLLFGNTASAGMLQILSFSVVPLCIAGICSTGLHASGTVLCPFIASMFGSLVKIVLCYIFTSNPNIHIYGVPIAAFIDFFILMVIDLILVRRYYGKTGGISGTIKLLSSGAVMAVFCWFIKNICFDMNGIAKICITAASAMTVYLICLMLFGFKNEIRK